MDSNDIQTQCDVEKGCGRKTDALKLKTIRGRDYLLCKVCQRLGGNYAGHTNRSAASHAVPDAGGQRGEGLQPA